VVATSLGFSLLAGCGLDGGGSADTFGGDGGANASEDGGLYDVSLATDGAKGNDGSGSDSPAVPPGDGCGGAEICSNGVDDNCDGHIDCDDPQCAPTTGWQCVAAVPAGWSIVSYEMNGHDACGAGFGSPANVVEGPSAATTGCACGGCTVTDPGSCTTGDFTAAIDGAVVGSCSAAPLTLKGGGGLCTKLAQNYKTAAGSKVKVTAAPWQGPGACTPAQPTPPAVTLAGQGETCTLATTPGGGCANGGACAPAATGSFAVCIAQAGDATCPSGFSHKHAVGSAVSDGRSCGTCSCSVTATCTTPQETLFTADACTTTGKDVATPVDADGQCDALNDGAGQQYSAYTYTALTNATCLGSGGALTGTLSLSVPQTICCP
jgi:hypothetical protein